MKKPKKPKKPKYELRIIRACKSKKGCAKTSWELSQGTTFESDPIIRKNAA